MSSLGLAAASILGSLELIGLSGLVALTSGSPSVIVGLIDGPVLADHPQLATENLRSASGHQGFCDQPISQACAHGTAVAGILLARRGSAAMALCPGCTLLLRPIFGEETGDGWFLEAAVDDLTSAVRDCIDAGARILNVSAVLTSAWLGGWSVLHEVLDEAARRGILVVVAAGNQRRIGGSVLTGHPAVIPVVACDHNGRRLEHSNLGHGIGRRGVSAPGAGIVSLASIGGTSTITGTSAAAAVVTGTLALLWSLFPAATAGELRRALTGGETARRASVVPPLLNVGSAYAFLSRIDYGGRRDDRGRHD